MRYTVTGAVATLALAVTVGTASAQHPGGHHGRGHPSYGPSYNGHFAHAPFASLHHQHGGHLVQPSQHFGVGVYSGPIYGPAGGFYPRPAYIPAYPAAPGYTHGHGYDRHHRGHH